MTIAAGCDVGSLTTKTVVLDNKRILGAAIVRSGPKPAESAQQVMKKVFEETGLSQTDINCFVGTGYGRDKISFVDHAVSEISCHARGAKWLLPSTRTIFDIGGQDCKVIRLDNQGQVEKFVTNDKCASGTGRFLDVMAKVMNIEISELSSLSTRSKAPVSLASVCTVWAQADVIKLINNRHPAEDICAGINTAMANRVSMLANTLKIQKDVCITGGVAKNDGVVTALNKILGIRIRRIKRIDPQLTGAVGAALFAQEKIKEQQYIGGTS
jgi:predicted CoA-substrate-specific enzyme activase